MADRKKESSPDEFMFSEFEIHASIFNRKNKDDYFMISSGTNQFPLSFAWKDALIHEIESDYLYRWYTSSAGFQSATLSLKIYEDFVSNRGIFFSKMTANDVCMAIGGSGAASLVFDYIKAEYQICEIVLVGMNYSLYERLARKYGFYVWELKSNISGVFLPSISDFLLLKKTDIKKVFVFSNPNNPTGATYDYKTFSNIVSIIKKVDGYIILDQVCDLPISKKVYQYMESAITENEMWDNTAVVNSFSKTDSTAGFRIGYIYGARNTIKAVSKIQANSIMNPPTFPVFSIIVTCMYRCMFLNRQKQSNAYKERLIRNLFRNVFFITGAIIPEKMKNYAVMIFDNVEFYYKNYIDEQLKNEDEILCNYKNTIGLLSEYIAYHSDLEGGFNFCVWFNRPFKLSELELVQLLINETGVAILTESAFTLYPTNSNSYFIRFSTACDKRLYREALLRVKAILDKGDIFDD